jgi:hypothetical protein
LNKISGSVDQEVEMTKPPREDGQNIAAPQPPQDLQEQTTAGSNRWAVNNRMNPGIWSSGR